MTTQQLNALITANIAGFQKGIQGAINSTQKFRQDFIQAARDVSTVATRMTAVVGGISIGITGALVKTGFSFDDLKQRSLIAFETMLGSGKKAQAFFDQLAKFAAETPFELRGLMQNVQTMMGMGFQAQQILPLLRAMGDAMAGMGKGGESLDRLVMTFAQMQARGRITGEELRELAHNGIGALQMLADAAGVTTGEMQKMVEKGMVPADFAIQTLVAGMNARFGGMMQKMVSTFSGAMSNLRDRSDQLSGKIVEPLFNAFGKFINDLQNDLGGPVFTRIVDGLRERFEQLARSFTQFVGENRAQIVEALGNALLWAANTAAQFAQWIVKAAPAMGQFAAQVWSVLQPIARWLADNPKLLAGLIALKVSGFLGLNSAIGSTLQAGGSFVSLLVRMLGATNSLKVGLVGLAVAAPFVALTAAAIKFNTEIEKSLSLTDRLSAKQAREHDEAMGEIAGKKPNEQVAALRARRAEVQRQLEQSLQGQQSAQEAGRLARGDASNRIIEGIDSAIPGFGGMMGAFGARHGVEAADSMLKKHQDAAKQRAAELAEIDRKLAEAQAKEEEPGEEEEFDENGIPKSPKDALEAAEKKKLADLMEAQRVHAINKEAPGFKDVHKLLKGGARGADLFEGLQGMGQFSDNAISAFMQALKEMEAGHTDTPEGLDKLAEALTRDAKDFADEGKRGEKADNIHEDFASRLEGMQDILAPERVAEFQRQIKNLVEDFKDGDISAEEFKRGLKGLDDSLHRASEGTRTAREFGQSLQQMNRDGGTKLGQQQIAGFQSAFAKLRKDFEDGKISADKFHDGVDNLRFEMDRAKQSADAQARAEERARHARGDFSQQEIQDAILDRMIGFQQQNLSHWVDSMLGLNNAVHGATQGLIGFGQDLMSVGSQIGSWPGGGGIGASIMQTMGAFGGGIGLPGFENTIAGPGFMGNTPMFMGHPLAFGSQAFGAGQTMFGQGWPQQLNGVANNFKNFIFASQGLQNQISFELQRLSLAGIDANSQTDVLNTIAGLKQQLASLRAPAPLFDRASTDLSSGYASDPGASGPHIGNIQFNMPNLTRVTNAEVSQLADGLVKELQRRGRSANISGMPLFGK